MTEHDNSISRKTNLHETIARMKFAVKVATLQIEKNKTMACGSDKFSEQTGANDLKE